MIIYPISSMSLTVKMAAIRDGIASHLSFSNAFGVSLNTPTDDLSTSTKTEQQTRAQNIKLMFYLNVREICKSRKRPTIMYGLHLLSFAKGRLLRYVGLRSTAQVKVGDENTQRTWSPLLPLFTLDIRLDARAALPSFISNPDEYIVGVTGSESVRNS